MVFDKTILYITVWHEGKTKMQLTIFQIRNLPSLYIHWLVQVLESFSTMLGPDENGNIWY